MAGGLIQLVAYGAQDVMITGNPQITFFKIVYRRHTNFAMETIQQVYNATPSSDGTSISSISKNKYKFILPFIISKFHSIFSAESLHILNEVIYYNESSCYVFFFVVLIQFLKISHILVVLATLHCE